MRASVRKLLLTLASTSIALCAAWIFVRHSEPSERSERLHASKDIALLENQLAPRGLGPFSLRPEPSELRREPLALEILQRLYPFDGSMVWDPHDLFRYRPNMEHRIEGQGLCPDYWRNTNSRGYREDHELSAPPPELFVLATGDSHTDGSCDNQDSWPNQLEALIGSARPARGVEVLNAGVQVYSFYHYLASIERALPLGPDVVVTLCYGGNDFFEALLMRSTFEHTVQPPLPREHWDAIKQAGDAVRQPELTQMLFQALYFRRHHDEIERALETAVAVCTQIQRLCAANGVRWLFAYLPSAYDAARPEWRAAREEDRAALGLSEEELGIANHLAHALLARLQALGVATLDLRETLRLADGALYWDEFHLSVHGNRELALCLLAPVLKALDGGG